MDLKRIFRSWMLVILLVFVLLVVVLKFTGSNQYRVVPTSHVMALVQNHKVRTATLTVPTQVIQVPTKHPRHLEATWVGTQDNQTTRPRHGNTPSYTDNKPPRHHHRN